MSAKKNVVVDETPPLQVKTQSSSTKIMQQMGGKSSMYDQARNYVFDAYTTLVKKHAENEKHRRELNKLQNQLNHLRDPAATDIEFKTTPPPAIAHMTGNKNIEELFSIANKYRHATTQLGNDAQLVNSQIKETQHAIRDRMKAVSSPAETKPSPRKQS